MGVVGEFIQMMLTTLFSVLGYLFPVLLILIGITIFVKPRETSRDKGIKILLMIALYIMLAIMFDVIHERGISLNERISLAYADSFELKGGGVVGALFGFLFYYLFGKIGTFLIILLLIFLSTLYLLNIPLREVFNQIHVLFTSFVENIKEKNIERKKQQNRESTTEEDDNIIYSDHSGYEETEKLEQKEKSPQEEPAIIIANPFTEEDEDAKNITFESKEDVPLREESRKEKSRDNKKQKTNDETEEIEPILVNEKSEIEYKKPSLSLLNKANNQHSKGLEQAIKENGHKIENTLNNFGIKTKVKSIKRGPTITCYEIEPSPDVKLNRIVNLSDNLALTLASSNIRIEAPIPGKSLVGIEVPNVEKDMVSLREMLESDEFKSTKSNVPLVLGKDAAGKPIISQINKMPHLLISGATGSGKSVCINSIILSILYKSDPEEVKMILVDPKVVELSIYNGIPHLLIPVVTDPKKASYALNWAVVEMEKRYKQFARNGVRDIGSYNRKAPSINVEKMPEIVVIIDELADLMMVASQEIEDYIGRLAQMARAAGIYLIVATQRPSVDVITGTIKANIPSRIAFSVSSQTDSRTILDMGGAEKLLGSGDMLFYPSFYNKPKRIQGCFVSDDEIEDVVESIKKKHDHEYDEKILESLEKSKAIDLDDTDPLLEEAIELVINEQQASISYLQRKLKLGYSRAARIVDQMEERGIVSQRDGTKPRNVLLTQAEWEERKEGI